MGIRLRKQNLIGALDIGTTKICAIIGAITADGLDIIGIGKTESEGLRKGVVVNIDATTQSISRAMTEAQSNAGCKINSVYAGIAGSHIQGFNSQGVVHIKSGEVSHADLERVVDAAKAMSAPIDREVLHALPQEFIIDGQDGIREPIGMAGVRLEAKIHMVTGAVASAQNIIKCAQRSGFDVNDIVLEQLASSMAVLTEDEKQMGVALIDIGGGTTDLAIFHNGSIIHTAVIAVAGQHLTNDVAVGLRTPPASAENIKRMYGCADFELIGKDEVIEVPSIGERPKRILKRQILGDILQPRVDEILDLIATELQRTGLCEMLASGVVLTGGTTLLPGLVQRAEVILGIPARHGFPERLSGLPESLNSPSFSTAVGLLLYGLSHRQQKLFRDQSTSLYARVKKRMGSWFQDMV